MGLLDELVGSLARSEGQVSTDQAGTLVRGVLEALGCDGADAGIDGLAQRLRSAGLGGAIESWIGTGANESVPPAQLDQALRGSPFESATKRAGLGGIAGAAILASLLPKLIDKLTPNGQPPDRERLRDIAAQAQSSDVLRGPAPTAHAAESGSPSGGTRLKADFSKVRSGASSTAPPPAEARRYTVETGDNLSKIAKRFYGDANQWRRIFDANRDQLSNPDLIHPGQVLNIPD
jgi:uncharacterized protein YidB (DUF937 family)